MKTFPKLFLYSFLIFGVLFVWWICPSFKKDPQPILVEIPQGAPARDIAKIMGEKGVVRSPFLFHFLARASGKSKNLKPGPYYLERNRYWHDLCKLESGLTASVKVTIPEGLTASQIAQTLREEGLLSYPTYFLNLVKKNNAEGRLFPETYFFYKSTTPDEIFQRMIELFNKNFAPFKDRAAALNVTQAEVLILASIIEREAELDAERTTISSVYHNRIKRGMLLQADPTVQYALSKGKYWKGRLTYKDLKVESPYNTYLHSGLPPGPICNPGKKSIEAALYPAETKYLYFVSTGGKDHNFFTTYREHLTHQLQKRQQKISKE